MAGAALSEFAARSRRRSAAEAMFEVQAIVARTYAAAHRGRHAREGFDLCSTTHCQLYEPARLRTDRGGPRGRRSTPCSARPALILCTTARRPTRCTTPTAADGRAPQTDVWGGPARPYLRPGADDGDAEDAHAAGSTRSARDALRRALERRSRSADRADRSMAITVLSRDASGRARASPAARGPRQRRRDVRGTDLREVLTTALRRPLDPQHALRRGRERPRVSCSREVASATASACARSARSRA